MKQIWDFLGKARQLIIKLLLGKKIYDNIANINDNIAKLNKTIINLEEKLKNTRSLIIKAINQSPSVQEINTKTFAKYRNINKGGDVAIFGSGPTLNYYEPIENVITIGVNTTLSKIKLDYHFLVGKDVINEDNKELITQYKCKKFYSFIGSHRWNLPIELREIPDVEEYCINTTEGNDEKDISGYDSNIYLDICKAPVVNWGSVIYSAAQFALWTYPKRIYIVGCDCTNFSQGHFDGTRRLQGEMPVGDTRFIEGWEKMKKFQQIYYPDVEMITINPVGLKGLFKDVFTKRYIQETYSNSAVYLRGYYSDGWIEKSSRYCILSGELGELTISGYYPNKIKPELTGKIILNDEKKSISITENNFEFVFNVKPETVINISIEMDFEFEAQPPDVRKLCFVLSGINTR